MVAVVPSRPALEDALGWGVGPADARGGWVRRVAGFGVVAGRVLAVRCEAARRGADLTDGAVARRVGCGVGYARRVRREAMGRGLLVLRERQGAARRGRRGWARAAIPLGLCDALASLLRAVAAREALRPPGRRAGTAAPADAGTPQERRRAAADALIVAYGWGWYGEIGPPA